jgi:hypothetical protein
MGGFPQADFRPAITSGQPVARAVRVIKFDKIERSTYYLACSDLTMESSAPHHPSAG